MTKPQTILSWVMRIAASLILLQTLYFKFSAAPESVAIFTKLHIEPWGRIGSGVAELIASLLLLMPRTVAFGAGMAMGIMAGAIASHLLVIGIESAGDGGQLFILALVTFICSAVALILHREQILKLLRKRS